MAVILHVDLDYFYAQVEERDNQQLKGKPVVVCVFSGRTEDSGSVATANYVAREYGVKAGIPIRYAKRKLKDVEAYFLPMRKSYYKQVSDEIMEILKSFSDKFEQTSIDEAYLDVTKRTNNNFDSAFKLAKKIQDTVYERVGLTCSIGIGPNKLIAKIASSYKKPRGITIVRPEDVEEFLEPLPVKKIPGVGVKIANILEEKRVKTIGDLRKIPLYDLIQLFGKKVGIFLYNAARGLDEEEVKEREETIQISRIATLKENTRNIDIIFDKILQLSTEVDEKLNNEHLLFRTITLILITTSLEMKTKSKTLNTYYDKLQPLKKEIKELLSKFMEEATEDVRRVGIRVSNLKKKEKSQRTLTDYFS